MPTKTINPPCWRLTNPDGSDYDEGEGTRHFNTEADARTYAANHLFVDGPTPKQWDRPCLLAFCDGCGDEFDDGVWGHTHFPDDKTVNETVGEYDDYRIETDETGTKMFCPNCPANSDDED